MKNIADVKAILIMVVGLNVLGYFLEVPVLNQAGIIIGLVSLIIPPAGKLILWVWFRIGHVLGWINTRIILGIIFYVFLTPLSLVYRLLNKDHMNMAGGKDTYYTTREHVFTAKDIENTW
jgi:hypothetical protein